MPGLDLVADLWSRFSGFAPWGGAAGLLAWWFFSGPKKGFTWAGSDRGPLVIAILAGVLVGYALRGNQVARVTSKWAGALETCGAQAEANQRAMQARIDRLAELWADDAEARGVAEERAREAAAREARLRAEADEAARDTRRAIQDAKSACLDEAIPDDAGDFIDRLLRRRSTVGGEPVS